MKEFGEWLAATGPSDWIRLQQAWLIPTVQSIHILALAIAFGSVFLISLRVLGLVGKDQTVRQVNRRFFPWLHAAMYVLLASGLVMLVGEPVRQLMAFSFWLKMSLLAVGLTTAIVFTNAVRRHETTWDEQLAQKGAVRAGAVVTILVWMGVIVCGRLIAYDHIWGSLSGVTQF